MIPTESHEERWFDLVVVGGGIGGLATASLAQQLGLRTALLEAHTKLGGCAGFFSRGPYTFDAGATALVGSGPGEPIGDFLDLLQVPFDAQATSSYRVHLPDRTLDIVPDPTTFEAGALSTFSAEQGTPKLAQQIFWRLQDAVGTALFAAAGRIPRLPVRAPSDLIQILYALGLSGLLAACTSILTVGNVLDILGLNRSVPFRTLIDILLQDTAQAEADIVPFANAAACLHAYRRGMKRPRGGMKRLAEGIGNRFALLGGDLRTATIVDRVQPISDPRAANASTPWFGVTTRRRQTLRTRHVVFNLPIDLAAKLLDRPLEGMLGRLEHRSRAGWSAFTGYLAIDRAAIADDSLLFHQVLQSYTPRLHDGNNILISLSPHDDTGYGPAVTRVATLSTRTHPADWHDLDGADYLAKKAQFQDRLLSALRRALPGADDALVHAEFASPRSFERYTRRTKGAVGGPPVSRSNSNLFAVDSAVLGPGLWLVGDSVFPGQGTMACVISGIRAVERISGTTWKQMSRDAVA
jgi:C-3',4' desaturase CrtD